MKRAIASVFLAVTCLAAIICVASVGAVRSSHPAASVSTPPLAQYTPAGALLYVQAADFSALLSQWENSAEITPWLKSSAYQVFRNSRLFLRLADAEKEFSSAAGVPTDFHLLRQSAGTESSLALYDIGKLEFLYITRLPGAGAMQSALGQAHAKFETRSAGNVTFFVRKDPQSGREVAFAVAGDYLLLATREDLLAKSLKLFGGEDLPTLAAESWWSHAVAAAGAPSELRMVLHLETIVPSPYFRSYWIQRNISELKQYSAAVSDLFQTDREFREERVLLRKNPATDPASLGEGSAAVADLLRLLPRSVGVYQAKANPALAECVSAIETKILSGAINVGTRPQNSAPQLTFASRDAAESSDLEARIDQPAVPAPNQRGDHSPLADIFGKDPAIAILQLQSSDTDADGIFVRVHSAIILRGNAEWNDAEVRSALADEAQTNVTTDRLGFAWQQHADHAQLSGLWPFAVATRGKDLFISDSPQLLSAVLSVGNRPAAAQPAVYTAGFNHLREKNNFNTMARILDSSGRSINEQQSPRFFSQTIGSLSATFHALASEKIVVHDQGPVVRQTVSYELAP
jgi:hypothetical protein